MKTFDKISVAILAIFGLALTFGLPGPLSALSASPEKVNLSSAGNFAILSKAAITDVPTSAITGNVGASPIAGTAIGLTCAEVTGTIYAVDGSGPLPCTVTNATLLTTAISNMETAYTDAAGRAPDMTELGSGNIGGLTLAPGVYKWSTSVTIPTNVTISGGANDIWIFQIAGDLDIAAAQQVVLAGGAKSGNIFWQVGGPTGATLATTSVFHGSILSSKQIILRTGATLYGRALAQTQVVLDQNTITAPTELIIDTCPSGDTSTSSYDGTCGTITTQTGTMNSQTGTVTTTQTGAITSTGYLFQSPPITIKSLSGIKFTDVSGNWAEGYILRLAIRGIVDNVALYRPNDNLTRAEYLKIVINTTGWEVPKTNMNSSFNDVSANTWYAKYVSLALSKGMISSNTSFRPNDSITRAEATKILMSTSGKKINEPSVLTFVDLNNTSGLNKYIETARSMGILSGQMKINGEWIFRPNDSITRAEIAKIVSNAFGLSGN